MYIPTKSSIMNVAQESHQLGDGAIDSSSATLSWLALTYHRKKSKFWMKKHL